MRQNPLRWDIRKLSSKVCKSNKWHMDKGCWNLFKAWFYICSPAGQVWGIYSKLGQHLPSLTVPFTPGISSVLSSKKIYLFLLKKKIKNRSSATWRAIWNAHSHGSMAQRKIFPTRKAALGSDKQHKIKCEGHTLTHSKSLILRTWDLSSCNS